MTWLELTDPGNANRLAAVMQRGQFVWRPGFMMVLEKSAAVRARPGDAIRAARLRRKGRSRIGELVRIELNRDNSIFDCESHPVDSVTFERHAVLDGEGRRWRYRDIIAAQAAYLRQEADCESRRTLDAQFEPNLPVVLGVSPEGDAIGELLNEGRPVAHVVDGPSHNSPFETMCLRPASEPADYAEVGAVNIKQADGEPVKGRGK
ncbi:hypothetical protein V6U71_21615 [Sphingopyxis sp. J-6]|uniref:hypothetical protein n=1 Tax=Sphingopyxis sp. J-6 TaxID=3122054 RepID=UPI003983FA41